MTTIIQKYAEEIATRRAEALDVLGKHYIESLRQIDDNPFIRKRWSFLERFFYKWSLGYVPKTPAEKMQDNLDEQYKSSRQQIERNITEYIKALTSYKAPNQQTDKEKVE